MATSVKLSDVVPSRFAHLTPSDETNVERIRADLETGSKVLLNNPHVFKNEAGKWELLAGHDRTEAMRRAGKTDLPVRDFTGLLNDDDAILAHFCKENLLRKDVSKAAIASEWLKKHPDWSDGRIAEVSGCSREHVSVTRADLGIANPQVLATSRTGLDGKTREYKPRQVRANVPSKRPIPHPTKTVAVAAHESPDEIAARLFAPKVEATTTPETGEVAPSEVSTASPSPGFSGSEVGDTPTGVESLPDVGPVGEHGAVPAWVTAALSIHVPSLTNEEARSLDEATCVRLEVLAVQLRTAVARSRALRSKVAA